jgi:hypothetical protein
MDMDLYTAPCLIKMNKDRNMTLKGIDMSDTDGKLYVYTADNRFGALNLESIENGVSFNWSLSLGAHRSILDILYTSNNLYLVFMENRTAFLALINVNNPQKNHSILALKENIEQEQGQARFHMQGKSSLP